MNKPLKRTLSIRRFQEAGPHSPKVKVQGELKKLSDSEENALVIKGSYEYYIEDNINKHGPSYTLVKVIYVADEKGYHPHIIFLPGAIQLLSQAVDPRVFATLLGSG